MGEKSWFNITTENADETEIVIYDEIGDLFHNFNRLTRISRSI